jgi:hypothetical protein
MLVNILIFCSIPIIAKIYEYFSGVPIEINWSINISFVMEFINSINEGNFVSGAADISSSSTPVVTSEDPLSQFVSSNRGIFDDTIAVVLDGSGYSNYVANKVSPESVKVISETVDRMVCKAKCNDYSSIEVELHKVGETVEYKLHVLFETTKIHSFDGTYFPNNGFFVETRV